MTTQVPAMAYSPARERWARVNLALGIALVVTGIFVDTAGLKFEFIVAAGGIAVVAAGLVGILLVLVKGMPARANLLGLIAIGLGVMLVIHDYVFGAAGPIVHVALGLLMIVFGILQIVGASRLVDLLGQTQTA